MNTKIVSELVGLEPELTVFNIEDMKLKGLVVKVIEVANEEGRVRCPYCNKYTRSVHDHLKPIRIKYLDIAGYTTYLKVYKQRFNCLKCGKRFTENNYINNKGKKLSMKLEQKILMDLREYNLSLKYIAKSNNISDNTVRNILKEYMKDYKKYLKQYQV